jgi:hypothetical protein
LAIYDLHKIYELYLTIVIQMTFPSDKDTL